MNTEDRCRSTALPARPRALILLVNITDWDIETMAGMSIAAADPNVDGAIRRIATAWVRAGLPEEGLCKPWACPEARALFEANPHLVGALDDIVRVATLPRPPEARRSPRGLHMRRPALPWPPCQSLRSSIKRVGSARPRSRSDSRPAPGRGVRHPRDRPRPAGQRHHHRAGGLGTAVLGRPRPRRGAGGFDRRTPADQRLAHEPGSVRPPSVVAATPALALRESSSSDPIGANDRLAVALKGVSRVGHHRLSALAGTSHRQRPLCRRPGTHRHRTECVVLRRCRPDHAHGRPHRCPARHRRTPTRRHRREPTRPARDAKYWDQQLRDEHGDLVLPPVHLRAAIPEASAASLPIHALAPRPGAAEAAAEIDTLFEAVVPDLADRRADLH